MAADLDLNEKRHCFELLDEYSKNNYRCFVSEFFRRREDDIYLVCIRPRGKDPSDPNRYACEYIPFDLRELKALSLGHPLTSVIIRRLDQTLSKL